MQLQVETQIYKKDAIGHDITEAGHKADEYITYIDAENGIQVHDKATVGTSYDDYVQINSDDISMWRDSKKMMSLDDDTLRFFGYDDSDNDGIVDRPHLLATYGKDGIVLYKPETDGTNKPVVTINSSGANIAGSVTIGGKIQDDYLNANVQVGGRNLLCGTEIAHTFTTKANQSWFIPLDTYTISTYGGQAIADTNNLEYTVSFNYATTGVETKFDLTFALKSTSTTYGNGGVVAKNIPVGEGWGHAEGTFKINDGARQYSTAGTGIIFTGSGNGNVNAKLIISNLKLEIGNKATDWSPAPEDVQAEIDTKKSTHTIDSTYSISYTNALTWANASHSYTGHDIDLTNVKIEDTVRLGVFISDMGDPNDPPKAYIVGTVTEVNASSFTMDGKWLDTTVIDGGHILTGTIDAQRVNISNLTVGGGWGDLLNSNLQIGSRNYAITNWTVTSPYTNSQTNVTSTLVGPSNFTLNGTAAATNWTFNKADTFGGQVLTTGTYLIWVDQPNVGIRIGYGSSNEWLAQANNCTKDNPYKLVVTTEQPYSFVPTVVSGVTYSNLDVHLMIEKGDNVTDWSPAPEDINNISYYGVCDTAAATAAKVVNNYNSFTLKAGVIVSIKFTNGNTCTSNLTLNVNNTGAKNIYMLNSNANISINLGTNTMASLMYDGTYWRVLSLEQVAGMVTRINDNGISIHPTNTTQHRVEITSEGMDVYQSGISVAKYGTTARIGAISANTYRTEITSNGFKILQRNSGNTADTEISSFNSSGISFNANIPLTVGTTNSYIKWIKENNVWKIKIQADEITMGGHSVDTGGTWYTGTAITGTSTTATVFSSSGITYASIGDMYLNTSTNNTYRCTVAGNATTAKWVYVSNLKGNAGSNGQDGQDGHDGQSYYVHIRYSANSDGTSFTTSPQSNTQYIGIYSGTSSTAPTAKTSYTWSKYKGDKGDDTSSQYMTFTETNGLRVYSGDKTSNTYNTSYTQIKTDGITLVKGGHTAATFGSSITLNKPGTETAVVTIDSNGNATINNIKATSGTIGGYDLTTNSIQAQIDASGNKVSAGLFWHFMSWGASNLAFGVGTRATTSDSWNWKFKVTHDGLLTATGADINGTLKAGAGSTIGPWTVSSSAIYNGKTAVTNTNTAGVYLGTDGLNISGGTAATTVYITKSAVNIGNKLTWNGSTLSVNGAITATSLTIDGNNYASDIKTISDKATTRYVDTAKQAAEKTATSYIADIDTNSGITIKAIKGTTDTNTTTGNYIKLNASGLEIYNKGVSVAFYGESARIGKDATPHIAVTSSEIQMWKGASSSSSNKLFSISTSHNVPAISSPGDIWIESGDIDVGFSSMHVSGAEAGLQAEDPNYDAGLYVIADGQSIVNVEAKYFQLESGCSLWYLDTAPPQGSRAYDVIWHKSSNGNYGLYRPSSSSKRYKEDIKPVEDNRLDPHRLYDIEVVQFKFKEGTFEQDDPYEQNRVNVVGFIAEDVLEHYPQAAIMIDDEVENWDERYIIPPMLKLIQEQNERIKELEEQVRSLL